MGYVSLQEGNYAVSNSSLIPMITGIFFGGEGWVRWMFNGDPF